VVCKDQRTQDVLQNIIAEQTNRINSLQKQDTQNEIYLKEVRGKIEAQKLESLLIDEQKEQAEKEGGMKGAAEAARVKTFLENLTESVPELSERLNIFNTLRKSEALEALSKGEGVSLFFTPQDVDLRINTVHQQQLKQKVLQ